MKGNIWILISQLTDRRLATSPHVFGTSVVVTVIPGSFTLFSSVALNSCRSAKTKHRDADMTPFQAFPNALSASVLPVRQQYFAVALERRLGFCSGFAQHGYSS
jgi:hypothetical protein